MNPLIMDLPYPNLDGITEDIKTAEIISPAYSARGSELQAIMQYLFHHFHFDGIDMQSYATELENIAVAEMRHFEILGSLLLKLGVNPVYTARPPFKIDFFNAACVSYSTTPQKMLMDDIIAEKKAIVEYQEILHRLSNERVAAIIERIILDEELHLKKFTEMLNSIINNCQEH